MGDPLQLRLLTYYSCAELKLIQTNYFLHLFFSADFSLGNWISPFRLAYHPCKYKWKFACMFYKLKLCNALYIVELGGPSLWTKIYFLKAHLFQ